jgi:iron(III) transport system substrate-binding protein
VTSSTSTSTCTAPTARRCRSACSRRQAANYAGNDVVETDGIELAKLEQEDVMAPYEGEQRDLVPEAGQFDTWTATRFNVFTPSWNTDAVSAADAPKSWEDLADPKWDGQLSMELGDIDWYVTLKEYWLDQGKSEDEVAKLFADMADGSPRRAAPPSTTCPSSSRPSPARTASA